MICARARIRKRDRDSVLSESMSWMIKFRAINWKISHIYYIDWNFVLYWIVCNLKTKNSLPNDWTEPYEETIVIYKSKLKLIFVCRQSRIELFEYLASVEKKFCASTFNRNHIESNFWFNRQDYFVKSWRTCVTNDL